MINCCVCRCIIKDDDYFVPQVAHPTYVFCADCYRSFRKLEHNPSSKTYQEIDSLFSDFVRNDSIPIEVRKVYRNADDAYWAHKESVEQYEANYNSAIKDLLLTTGSHFDGYKVAQYLDIVSCEIVFKHSLINSLSAAFSNFIDMLSFQERELEAETELIDHAKEYIMTKFRKKAVEMGANAILGVDFETTFGSDIVKISVNGTAVVIDKIE